jgi:hypothetical protein
MVCAVTDPFLSLVIQTRDAAFEARRALKLDQICVCSVFCAVAGRHHDRHFWNFILSSIENSADHRWSWFNAF